MRTFFGAMAALVLLVMPASAQQNHERHHDDYKSWSSTKTSNCCNNQDCGTLADEDVRNTPTGTEVKIDGEWCPVKPEHFIVKGKSPDWNVAHACILQTKAVATCDRLLCFSGKGGF